MWVIHHEALNLNVRSRLSSAFGAGVKQLERRFQLLAFVVRQIHPEIATVKGVGTVYIPDMKREIPQSASTRKEVGNSGNRFVYNLEVL